MLIPVPDPDEHGNNTKANNKKVAVAGENGKTEGKENEKDEKATRKVARAKKEKSVLQTKLTRLAIQIGYAGKLQNFFASTWTHLVSSSS